MRDECLNQHHFPTLPEALTTIETWRQEYSAERPRKNLEQQAPAEYAALLAPQETLPN